MTTQDKPPIKGVDSNGYPMLTTAIHLPRLHPLPLWCACGAALPWIDLGVLAYKYPDRDWRVFICGECGKHSVFFPVEEARKRRGRR